MDLTNTLYQARIILSAWAWLTILPVVIATGRHLQTTAHQSDWVLVAAALDHRVPFDDSLAKYAAVSSTCDCFWPAASSDHLIDTTFLALSSVIADTERLPVAAC